jgi:hypothetical protein
MQIPLLPTFREVHHVNRRAKKRSPASSQKPTPDCAPLGRRWHARGLMMCN